LPERFREHQSKLTIGTVLDLKKRSGASCNTTQKAAGRSVDRFQFSDDYVTRLRGNDAETWEHFDGYFRPRIRAKFRAQFPWEKVDDLSGDTMLAVIEKIRQGEPRDAACLAAYVFQICHNKALEAFRKLTGERGATEVDWNLFAGNGKTPQQKLLDKEQAQKVDKVFKKLASRDRQTLAGVFYEGRDRDEVCREYGITRDQFRMILFHARKRFQREWERD
jgi:RNA polymerase sigma-70 factor, ECF subfamily